jgi:hypothetical protein
MGNQFFKYLGVALVAGLSGFGLAAFLPSAGPGESLLGMNGRLLVDIATEDVEWLPGHEAEAEQICEGFRQRWEAMSERQVEERQESLELLVLGLNPLLDAEQTQLLHNNVAAYQRAKK